MLPEHQGQTLQMAQAQQVLDNSVTLIRAVTTLADRREVVASEDIFAQGGMKLISQGARLSGRFYEHLTAHKLLRPLEQSIAIADAPDAQRVIVMAHAAAQRIPSLQPLLGEVMLARLGNLLAGAVIPKALATKLVVMQEERPRLFQHSLLAATIAMVLGIRAELPQRELHALALAALFHDVGELYIDPTFFASGKRMSMDERRHLYVHPVTGFLILRNFPELPEGTAQAVLQHHERLDAAGYPYRLRGDAITRIARFLAVAEVAASLVENHGADRRIGIKFRMNIQKYDRQAVTLISGLFEAIDTQAQPDIDEHALIARLAQLGELFAGWQTFVSECRPEARIAIASIIDRMDSMRMMVLEPGFDQCRLEDIVNLAGEPDSQICTELSVLLEELGWHFGALCRGVERDRLVWGMRVPAEIQQAFDLWLQKVYAFLEKTDG